MKYIALIFAFIVPLLPCSAEELTIKDFLEKHPKSYQDILVNNQVVAAGTDLCSERYEMIRPILNSFQRPFTVLDLGAAQGYFSFRMAHDYPQCSSVMIDANTTFYTKHGDVLYDLCQLNSHLKNVSYLNRSITISDLEYLNQNEHFDVVVAFLVVHLMQDDFTKQVEVIEHLLKLTDNLIIEVANDVAVVLSSYVEYISGKMDCQYLGKVTRHTVQDCPFQRQVCPCSGKLFWFRAQNSKNEDRNQNNSPIGIKKETFQRLNGMYPITDS